MFSVYTDWKNIRMTLANFTDANSNSTYCTLSSLPSSPLPLSLSLPPSLLSSLSLLAGDTHTYPSALAEMLTQIITGVHAAHFHLRVSPSPCKTTTIGKQSCLLLFCLNWHFHPAHSLLFGDKGDYLSVRYLWLKCKLPSLTTFCTLEFIAHQILSQSQMGKWKRHGLYKAQILTFDLAPRMRSAQEM